MKIIYFFTLSLMMCYAFANSTLAAVELFEPFDSDILCPKPEGWTVINHSTGCNWIFGSNWENSTGGEDCFAFADSHASCATGSVDTSLVTPSIDCSSLNDTVLSFNYDAYTESTAPQSVFIVQVSIDGGVWVTHDWQPSDKRALIGPQKAIVDISLLADGKQDVRIRFRYTATTPWWWQIDNVKVASKFNWLPFMPAIIANSTL